MFSLKNLSSISVEKGKPWEFTSLELVPKACLGKNGKKARNEWATDPKTNFFCYSGFEGVNCNLRIRADRGNEEGNPPHAQHLFVADYDYKLTEEEVSAGIERMPPDLRPQWRETTLSGNLRLVWVFAFPLPIPSYAFAAAFQLSMADVIPYRQLAGLDEGALKAPERYYTNGCVWQRINPNPFPHALIAGQWTKFSNKFDFKGAEFNATLPIDVAAEQLRTRFPRFAEWPGEFKLDAQGPSFWIDGSLSPMSAIVKEWGLLTFAGHAGKSKYTWPELLGADFVNRFRTEQIGRSSEGIYYDEKSYFSKNSSGIWCVDPRDNITLLLRHERGLTDVKKKGETTSEVERALCYIQRRNRVRVAAPFPFYKEGMTNILGETVLNTHTRRAIAPAEAPGPFPFIEKFITTLLDPAEQLDYMLSWASYHYRACVNRCPRSGQAVYLAGGPDIGKTFLSRGIFGGLFGGFAECQSYILGDDQFNSELFEYGLWVMDDSSIAPSFLMHKKVTEKVKALVANPSMRCRGLYQKGGIVVWQGRIFITLNLDPESKRQLPDMDLSMRGKVMIFRAVEFPKVQFLEKPEMEEMLTRELPYFGRFLMDYQIPAHCKSADPRFGIVGYLEKSLVDSANQNSVSGAFAEILADWTRTYFCEMEPEANKWEGTSLKLYKDMHSDHSLTEALRTFNVQAVGRMLVSLAAKNVFGITVSGDETKRTFTIPRDEKEHPRRPTQPVIINSSKFEKPA